MMLKSGLRSTRGFLQMCSKVVTGGDTWLVLRYYWVIIGLLQQCYKGVATSMS